MSYLTWILLSVCLCVTSQIQSYFCLAEIYSTELRFSAVLLLSFWILPKFWCLDFFKNSAKLWLSNWCKSYTLGQWKLIQQIVGCSTQRWRGNPARLVYRLLYLKKNNENNIKISFLTIMMHFTISKPPVID